MNLHTEIKKIQNELGIPDEYMAELMGVRKSDYVRIKQDQLRPSVYSLIMLITYMRRPLLSLNDKWYRDSGSDNTNESTD